MSSPQEKSNVASAGTGLLQVVGHTASMNNAPTAMPTNETYGSSTGGEMTASASASAATLTITEEEARPPREDFDELLTLSLRARPSVRWDENVVDNEGLGRKSSKRCCIFHKERSFGESSTDSSDYDSDRSGSSSSTSSTSSNNNTADGEKKASMKHKKKIARPRKGKKVPDSQRYHA